MILLLVSILTVSLLWSFEIGTLFWRQFHFWDILALLLGWNVPLAMKIKWNDTINTAASNVHFNSLWVWVMVSFWLELEVTHMRVLKHLWLCRWSVFHVIFCPSELKDHCKSAKCWFLCCCVGGRRDTRREVGTLIRWNLSYFSRTWQRTTSYNGPAKCWLLEFEHIAGGGSQDCVIFVMIWLPDARSGVRIMAGARIFLLSKMSRLAVGPTQPPIQ